MGKRLSLAEKWFRQNGWKPFPFQQEAWKAVLSGESGLVNAPTGSGKTYSLLLPLLERGRADEKRRGLQAIWITPIRALGKEIEQSAQRAVFGLGMDWRVETRTGDTDQKTKARQKRSMPEILITTPESLHILLSSKGYSELFRDLQTIVVDEWHELIGSKRGVQVELGLSRFRGMNPQLQVWGISATIGNMEQAIEVLHGPEKDARSIRVIRSETEKDYRIVSILPDEVETLPWAGHLGIRMLEKVIPIIEASKSTLIFTNTRSQAEIWYQRILEVAPDMAGLMAMHHGSISRELRSWVEDSLYDGHLKAVVCTSSLDLGVDFRPVETIIQIGSPKGVARFMQRAGRSGHRPGALSTIYFVPTHSLELIEAAALREAIEKRIVEERIPYVRSFDVLVQYLITLAVSEGFKPNVILPEIRSTFSFHSISDEEWNWCLDFITRGGASLSGYEDFHRVEIVDGVFLVTSRRIAMRHRMSIGTIVSDTMMRVKFVTGGYLGSIEEWFISRLKPGDVFWFAGRVLELIRVKGLDVQVRASKQKTAIVPSWQGGRMPLSAQLGAMLRKKLEDAHLGPNGEPEIDLIQPIIQLQEHRSIVPSRDQFLIEVNETREGHHVFCFPFEGRLVHEGMAALLAYRLSLFEPISFSIAMNDYGFELLSDKPIPMESALDSDIFTTRDLREDIHQSVNETEMARRRFRDIAGICGLVFSGYPGKPVKEKHLQSSSSLIFDVLAEYEPESLILQQAYQEVHDFQLEEARLRTALERISNMEIVLTYPEHPSPLAFPIMVDRLSRNRLSSESLADQIKKLQAQFRS